jgi:hypothetical protein
MRLFMLTLLSSQPFLDFFRILLGSYVLLTMIVVVELFILNPGSLARLWDRVPSRSSVISAITSLFLYAASRVVGKLVIHHAARVAICSNREQMIKSILR